MPIKTVLFVCTGNSCRSVMAKAILEKRLKECKDSGKLNHEIQVKSAGICALDGMGVSANTKEILMKDGIDVSGHFARRLTDDSIKEADLILVMADMHKDDIIHRVPEASNKVFLLKEFQYTPKKDENFNPDILDPIGKPMEVFEVCYQTIKECVERVVRYLCESQ